MIYDDFANFDRYNAVAPSIWGKVKEFIADALKKGSLEAGRYEISGSQCFVNAAVYDTKTLDSTKLEAHKEYLDIQMTLSGAERIACHDIDGMTVVAPYSQEKDIAFYDMTMDEVTDLVISSSRFAVFYPGEGHLPGCDTAKGREAVNKIIVKIHRSLLA